MARELYMVGLIVRDMRAPIAFYRQLGLAIPEGSEDESFVAVEMTGMSLFFDASASSWDPEFAAAERVLTAEPPSKHGHVLEFNLVEREAVDAMYATLVRSGYRVHRAPYATPFGAYFALVFDPDGNMVLFSA